MTDRDLEGRSGPQGAGASGRLADQVGPVGPARHPLPPTPKSARQAKDSPEESAVFGEDASPGPLAAGDSEPTEVTAAGEEGAPGSAGRDRTGLGSDRLEGLFDLPDDLAQLDAAAIAGIPQLSQLDVLKSERDEYLDALRRLQADFDNFRKRIKRQQEEQAARGVESLVERLLPVLDALDLAVAHAGDAQDAAALTQVAALLHDVLAREGLERIDVAGVAFEPTIHDAVAHVPREAPARGATSARDDERAGADDPDVPLVAEVLRPGYLLKGKVVRPAMVKVSG
jgi:molecular chaperone GrpE